MGWSGLGPEPQVLTQHPQVPAWQRRHGGIGGLRKLGRKELPGDRQNPFQGGTQEGAALGKAQQPREDSKGAEITAAGLSGRMQAIPASDSDPSRSSTRNLVK